MKPHSVFLRNKCILPAPLDPLTEPVGEHWARVEEIAAPVFDTMIRQKGWHFMAVDNARARRGFGMTAEGAVQRALARALRSVAGQFNAADLVAVQARKYPGFHMAEVTLQPRQIQPYTWLEIAGDWQQLPAHAR